MLVRHRTSERTIINSVREIGKVSKVGDGEGDGDEAYDDSQKMVSHNNCMVICSMAHMQ